MKIRVYCEDGALCPQLKQLDTSGRIELMVFPYEARSKKIRGRARPSKVTADSTHVLASDSFLVSESESEMYPRIRKIVGGHNEFDVRHIDSAYKTGCKWFFTRDKDDILDHRKKLEELLGIRFFHPDEINLFEEWLARQKA